MDSIRAVESQQCAQREIRKGILPAQYPPAIRRQQRTANRRGSVIGSHQHLRQIQIKTSL